MKVLKFGAVWCPGCLVMKPRWAKIEEELAWLETEYYDINEREDLVEKYQLIDYPVFVFLDKNGREFLRLSGEIDRKELRKIIIDNKNR